MDGRLTGMPNGTFLVRWSEKQSRHVITIAFDGEAKHVLIEQGAKGSPLLHPTGPAKVADGVAGFWLDEGSNAFPSIVDLVRYYSLHNMKESFQALDTTLAFPFKAAVLSVARALHNFEPTSPTMVGLRRGQEVLVLSKNGDERGWWKGKVTGKIGYFPLAYVRELDSTLLS